MFGINKNCQTTSILFRNNKWIIKMRKLILKSYKSYSRWTWTSQSHLMMFVQTSLTKGTLITVEPMNLWSMISSRVSALRSVLLLDRLIELLNRKTTKNKKRNKENSNLFKKSSIKINLSMIIFHRNVTTMESLDKLRGWVERRSEL